MIPTTTPSIAIAESAHAARNPFAAFMDPKSLMAAHDRLAAQVQQSVIHRPLDKLPAPPSSQEDIAADFRGDPQTDLDAPGRRTGLGDLSGLVNGFAGFT